MTDKTLDEWERRQTEAKRSKIKLVPWDEIKLSECPYLVRGLIPMAGLTVVWGPPKSGKSFFAFDLMMHVARGLDYRGRSVEQGPVVYCAFEGQAGIGKRVEAYKLRHEPEPDVPFWQMPMRLDLVADHAALGDAIAGISPSPVCIVLDTLNRSLRGSESLDRDMGAWIDAADALRERFGCAVIIVHHCGWNDAHSRGHSSLIGAVACELSVKRDQTDNVILTIENMRDGEAGDVIASRLEVVTLLNAETSCVVVPVDDYTAAKPEAKGARLSNAQKLARDALVSLAAKDGKALPASFELPTSIRAVPFNTWRTELLARRIVDPEGSNPRARVNELRDALKAKYLAGERELWIWPIL